MHRRALIMMSRYFCRVPSFAVRARHGCTAINSAPAAADFHHYTEIGQFFCSRRSITV